MAERNSASVYTDNSQSVAEKGTPSNSDGGSGSNGKDDSWWVNVLPERMRRGVQVRFQSTSERSNLRTIKIRSPRLSSSPLLRFFRVKMRLSAGDPETIYKPAVATAAQLWRIRKRSQMAALAADRRDPLELEYPYDPLDWLTEYTLVKYTYCIEYRTRLICVWAHYCNVMVFTVQ